MQRHLFCFGFGYSAAAVSLGLLAKGWRISGTTRNAKRLPEIHALGVCPVHWPENQEDLSKAFSGVTHVLVSTPPDAQGDPVLQHAKETLCEASAELSWIGYLSTTGVYGDHQGAWVDEDTPSSPQTLRGHYRMIAERQWQDFADEKGFGLHIFRLAGIYGPKRGPFQKIRLGKARRIIKPGQFFSRIHVSDIAQVLAASIATPNPGRIYNVCDDLPAPPQDVIAYAAKLLNLPPPVEIPFDKADLSPMARSFYSESKRVVNERIHSELGVILNYPNYQSGLRAILEEETHMRPMHKKNNGN